MTQIETLELKSTIIDTKNSLQGLKSQLKLGEESANLKIDQLSNLKNRNKNEEN